MKSGILIEALPYIREFQDKYVVVKYGGSALKDKKKRRRVLEDIIFMSLAGMKPVVVHGGGPFINKKMRTLDIKSDFIDGLRVTGEREIKIIKEVLASVNRKIVKEIRALGGKAQTVYGTAVIKVRRHRRSGVLGYVGEVRGVDSKKIEEICGREIIPVISPLGMGKDRHIYNINADQASAYIARELVAVKLALLTNVDGIYSDGKSKKNLISSLKRGRVRTFIKRGVISTGMIPKVKACTVAINGGVRKAHIINGSLPHALLLEIFTDEGIGTEVVK